MKDKAHNVEPLYSMRTKVSSIEVAADFSTKHAAEILDCALTFKCKQCEI